MLTHMTLLIPTEKQNILILSGNTFEVMGHSMEEEENGHQMWPWLCTYWKQESVGGEKSFETIELMHKCIAFK